MGEAHLYGTLAAALAAIARMGAPTHSGTVVNASDAQHDSFLEALKTALGEPFLICAVPAEPDIALWPMYARDGFLIPAGRLFGLEIRDMHPPEAAVGLREMPEFGQHFDASYRPLIARALENGQAVLAWRGWEKPFEPCWGIVRGPSEAALGFSGEIHASSDPRRIAWVTMAAPPVQLYVVETCRARTPSADEVCDLALRAASALVDEKWAAQFAVKTGECVFDELAEFARRADRQALNAIGQFALAHMAAVAAGRSFLEGLRQQCVEYPAAAGPLLDYCRDMESPLAGIADDCAADANGSRTELIAGIHRAKSVSGQLRAAAR